MRAESAIRNLPGSFNQTVAKLSGTPVKTYRVVSLFSGCGGMDLGFLGGFSFGDRFYDRLPFRIVWANDINTAAGCTYAENMKHSIVVGDVAEHMDQLPKTAEVVIGGFPCQDVSINGARQGANGERTILYKYMISAIERTKPRIFVAENVKGLLQAHGKDFLDTMLSDFAATGYRVSHRLYLAADYGVPQMRERLFIVGVKGRREFEHPAPDLRHMTAQEALSDLEDAKENEAIGHVWSKAQASPDQGNRRLKADKPATTIRAEHHGNIQWHYNLDRRLSLREAARLQSFPDGFRFHGGMRERERMIGNAVPPVLAWHIAKAVREFLDPGRVRAGS
ncbi:MAG: DNA cytosine methyltransferase [bacterium]|nr:DNA cytosine methyltransferase [bacterium]